MGRMSLVLAFMGIGVTGVTSADAKKVDPPRCHARSPSG